VNTQSPSAELAQLTQHERTFYWRLDVEAQAGHCQAWTLHPSKALRNWGTLTASYVQGERRVVQERSFAIVRNALHVYAGSLKVSDDTTQTSERLSQWRVYYFEPGQSPYTTGLWHPSASECSQ
jgi:hypothetical protein